jgi:NADH-quinone oxidoreductase subunit J
VEALVLTAFWIAAAVAVAATVLAVSRSEVIHALLYLVVSFLATAVMLFVLGAPFVAALEVIVYAGAILVLFVFAVMLLDRNEARRQPGWARPRAWAGPAVLAVVVLVETVVLIGFVPSGEGRAAVPPAEVGAAVFGPYLVGVEAAAFLLLAGLVGAFHLSRGLDSGEEDQP